MIRMLSQKIRDNEMAEDMIRVANATHVLQLSLQDKLIACSPYSAIRHGEYSSYTLPDDKDLDALQDGIEVILKPDRCLRRDREPDVHYTDFEPRILTNKYDGMKSDEERAAYAWEIRKQILASYSPGFLQKNAPEAWEMGCLSNRKDRPDEYSMQEQRLILEAAWKLAVEEGKRLVDALRKTPLPERFAGVQQDSDLFMARAMAKYLLRRAEPACTGDTVMGSNAFRTGVISAAALRICEILTYQKLEEAAAKEASAITYAHAMMYLRYDACTDPAGEKPAPESEESRSLIETSAMVFCEIASLILGAMTGVTPFALLVAERAESKFTKFLQEVAAPPSGSGYDEFITYIAESEHVQ